MKNNTIAKINKRLIIIFCYAVAMGFLEAIVVVYLRGLFYPEGFSFPLKLLSPHIFKLELVREFTTLVMLICIGLLAGRTFVEKFSWFMFAFGVWDISYYAGLKIFLNWPPSLFTWDVLFLIPVTWTGPVLAPLISSLTMIVFSFVLFTLQAKQVRIRFDIFIWLPIMIGTVLVFISFVSNYTDFIIQSGEFKIAYSSIIKPGFIHSITSFIPVKFHWALFGTGEIFILTGIIIFIKRIKYGKT